MSSALQHRGREIEARRRTDTIAKPGQPVPGSAGHFCNVYCVRLADEAAEDRLDPVETEPFVAPVVLGRNDVVIHGRKDSTIALAMPVAARGDGHARLLPSWVPL